MLNLDAILETHSDGVKRMFDKFNIEAPVTKETVELAMSGIPSFRNVMLNTFENFEGEKAGDENQYEFETDALTGEEKKVKRKQIAKDVFGFAKDTAQNYIKTKQMSGDESVEEGKKIDGNFDEVKKTKAEIEADRKKIFGMSPMAFYGLCLLVILIVIALILKFKNKS